MVGVMAMEEITYLKWSKMLKGFEIFEGIEESEIDRLMNCLNPRISEYKKNEHISIEKDGIRRIGIVMKGEVTILKENEAGDRVIIGKVRQNGGFGEMLAFSGNDQLSISVMASKDSKILFLTPGQVLGTCAKLCSGHKRLIQNMLKIVTKKGVQLNRKIDYLSIKGIRRKISTYLLEQMHESGKAYFTISLNRKEMAEFLNVSRPSLSREMIRMKEEGLIDFYKASFKILDEKSLRDCLHT